MAQGYVHILGEMRNVVQILVDTLTISTKLILVAGNEWDASIMQAVSGIQIEETCRHRAIACRQVSLTDSAFRVFFLFFIFERDFLSNHSHLHSRPQSVYKISTVAMVCSHHSTLFSIATNVSHAHIPPAYYFLFLCFENSLSVRQLRSPKFTTSIFLAAFIEAHTHCNNT